MDYLQSYRDEDEDDELNDVQSQETILLAHTPPTKRAKKIEEGEPLCLPSFFEDDDSNLPSMYL